jgi:hypothetical protein
MKPGKEFSRQPISSQPQEAQSSWPTARQVPVSILSAPLLTRPAPNKCHYCQQRFFEEEGSSEKVHCMVLRSKFLQVSNTGSWRSTRVDTEAWWAAIKV